MGLDLSTDVIANVHFTALDRGWFKQQMRTFTAGMWGEAGGMGCVGWGEAGAGWALELGALRAE